MPYMNDSLESFLLIRVDDPDPIKEEHKHTTARQIISHCDICRCEIFMYDTMSTGK
jgi:hypothetical protein